jgi:hypothetical protein
MACRLGVATMLLVVVASNVTATEKPIAGNKLSLRRSASGRERLTFVSKDPAFLFPTPGGADDPTPSGSSGLVVELFAPSTPSGVALVAPGGLGNPGWTVRVSAPATLRFKNPAAPASPSTFKAITLKQGKIVKLAGRETGLDLSAPLGSVGIRITSGSLVSCALFRTTSVRKDVAGTFSAANAPASALADCSDAALASSGTTTTTTTTVTTTTAPGVCGDDLVNQTSEQCDGTDRSVCLGFDCGPPGYTTQCQCCGMTTVPTFPSQVIPCCDPSAQEVFFPSTAFCVNHDCSGGVTCSLGGCVDGACCSPVGQTCGLIGGGGIGAAVPCCDASAVCGAPAGDGVSFLCCVTPGGDCSIDSDCCGGTCTGGTCGP